jgi:4-aminobutyrate aminotransferase-like enzyme/Ser/Thr protein kinase RdoA (MazF antagonist)
MIEPLDARDVLQAPPPRFGPDEAARFAAEAFGIEGVATPLGSERDQNFLIDDGGAGGILKISNSGEDPGVLDMETEAILHVARVEPELPVARPHVVLGHDPAEGPAAYRRAVAGPDGTHHLRLFDRMPGRASVPQAEVNDEAVSDFGTVLARLGRALRGFFHPAAGRVLLWDGRNTPALRPRSGSIDDPDRRALVLRTFDRFDQRVAPLWPTLRAQVIHGDLTLDNALLDDAGRVSGIVDFGDMSHTALVWDVPASTAQVLAGFEPDETLRRLRLFLDGYERVTPLEDTELEVLADLLAVRLAMTVTISAWRVGRYPENAAYMSDWDEVSWPMLEWLDAMGLDEAARRIGAGPAPAAPGVEDLVRRRERLVGPAMAPLTYTHPLHLVRGEGVWMFDAEGRRFLDAYNNVPVVGHGHPRVAEAIARQTRALNTNMRYLHETVIELGERLVASMPDGWGLDTVLMVNSGSEANDLAWRMALAWTGHRGGIVTEPAYHGVTSAVADLSPEEWRGGYRPQHVETVPSPSTAASGAPELSAAAERLKERGAGLAAVLVDPLFTADGILTPPAAYVTDLVKRTHDAGGLFVADEVQAGHGRTGAHLWSFAPFGSAPDFVTLGKPMGNGFPVAALVTRREIAERFAETTEFFSTFGGNPVAAAAALAVLRVIEDEGLVERTATVGAALAVALEGLASTQPLIRQVRGRGLLIGVDLGDPDLVDAVKDGMRDRAVLIGSTGPSYETLKIRPPLVFGVEQVDTLVGALRETLDAV